MDARSRWPVIVALALASTINFLDRAALGVLAPQIQAEFHLDTRGYQAIINAFLLAFTLSYAFGGALVDRIGARKGLTLALTAWSLAAMAHGLAQTPGQLSLCRALLGLGEGLFWPVAVRVAAEWFESKERGRPIGLATAGAGIGTALAPVLVTALQSVPALGWRGAFVATGGLGLFLFPFWIAFAPRSGAKRESDTPDAASHFVPLRSLMRHRSFWTLLTAQALANAVTAVLLYYLLLYLQRERGFTTIMIGRAGWIPFAFADLGAIAGGFVASRLMERGYAPLAARKTTLILSGILTPFFVVAYFVPVTAPVAAMALLCLGCFGYAALAVNVLTLTSDLFPLSRVGAVMGITGAVGSIGAILITSNVAALIDRTGTYLSALIAAGCLPTLAALVVVIGIKQKQETSS